MNIALRNDSQDFKKAAEFGIEDGMEFLCKYGTPRMSKVEKGGWYVRVDMFVTGKGIKFEIDSDFGVVSMKGAVQQCIERLLKALSDLEAK